MIPLQGGLGVLTEIPANISWLWGVPSASGYGPLILNRYRQLMRMDAFGKVEGDLLLPKNRGLDMMSVRYLFAPSQPKFVDRKFGIVWNYFDLDINFGDHCGSITPGLIKAPIKINLPENFKGTHLGIVSSLACSVEVQANSKMLRFASQGGEGEMNESFLLAGRDTAEWMHDCENVISQVKHPKAKVFKTVPTNGGSLPCNGYRYFATLPLDSSKYGKTLTLEKVGWQGTTRIHKLTLYNETTKQSYPLVNLIDPEHFRWVERLGQTDVFENLKALPRAWLVYDVKEGRPQDILKAVSTSQMPDGTLFDPRKTALVEDAWVGNLGPPDPQARVDIVKMNDTVIGLETHSTSASFLMLSDIYYPGWQATVDGQPAQIFQANYVLRGLQLPAGNHQVKFEYKPRSMIHGAVISLSSVAILGLVAWVYRGRRRRENRDHG